MVMAASGDDTAKRYEISVKKLFLVSHHVPRIHPASAR
jgi:hypothetical protein